MNKWSLMKYLFSVQFWTGHTFRPFVDHGEAIKTWLKAKLDPITVTCGHKKGPQ